MTATSKMVFGDQFQIKLDPSKLEAKNRGEWGRIYLDKQAQKGRMFVRSMAMALASAGTFIASVQLRSFYKFGYDKGILDDWETKIMIRVDK